ncbi:MAG: histidine kinase [Deltaproteobacteria bacterium RIFOXYD12_FULL_50_9]|nr:MAG: histidine kinase [Deltaproteobacteria bacterium RIFOXYD12_FULL_50_9]
MLKKILIVDDSPVARLILKKCLPQDRDFTFLDAGNGQEGVEIFEKENPDLVFMDLTMPVMNGMQALEIIKKKNNNALVIVVTADIQSKSLMEVAKLGALMVLKKPPTQEKAEKAIRKAEEAFSERGSI